MENYWVEAVYSTTPIKPKCLLGVSIFKNKSNPLAVTYVVVFLFNIIISVARGSLTCWLVKMSCVYKSGRVWNKPQRKPFSYTVLFFWSFVFNNFHPFNIFLD